MMNGLFELQLKVDEQIQNKINVSFEKTLDDRKIAFHVELGEFANEVGFFKYWKESHEADNFRVKDEWADCLAFLLSIANSKRYHNDLKIDIAKYSYDVIYQNITNQYKQLMFNKLYDYVDVLEAFRMLYQMGCGLGYSIEELNEAYINKSKENIRRAEEGY